MAALRLLGSHGNKVPDGKNCCCVGLVTYLFGKTRVMPPSVAANTASRLYLGATGRWGHRPAFYYGRSGPLGQPQPPAPHSHSLGGGAYVLRSWSRHTRSTNCCVMPVSKIRLCKRKLLPGIGQTERCLIVEPWHPCLQSLVKAFSMPWSRSCLLVSRPLSVPGFPPVSMPRLHPEAPPYTHTAWSPESLSP